LVKEDDENVNFAVGWIFDFKHI